MTQVPWSDLPFGSRVLAGLAALRRHEISCDGLLILMAASRLRGLGVDVPTPNPVITDPENSLYRLLQKTHGNDAHAHFNALRREIVSFAEALEHLIPTSLVSK